MGHPFEHSLPGRTHARAVHIFIHVNGCRPEFHPVFVLRQTRVTPRDLVLIGRMNTALWSMDSRVGWASIFDPRSFGVGLLVDGISVKKKRKEKKEERKGKTGAKIKTKT